MDVSARMPRGVPSCCPICGAEVAIERAEGAGAAMRARCGHLSWHQDDAGQEVMTARLGPRGREVDEWGEVDPTQQEIHRLHERVAHMNAVPRLVLDFADVAMVSSRAMGELLILDRVVKVASGRLSLSNVRPDVEAVFQVMGLDQLFEFHGAVDSR